MTAEQFAYWMQGFAELTGEEVPTSGQWRSIREHLQTVFMKVTPPLQNSQPAVNDPSTVPPLRPNYPPYDWQRPAIYDGRPLIATCIASPNQSQTTCQEPTA
jgi:hypothetical protein